MIVRKGVKVFAIRALRVLSAILDEWGYQLSHLSRVIETPKVVREAEKELARASIMEQLEKEDPFDSTWDQEDEWEEDDGREWHFWDDDRLEDDR